MSIDSLAELNSLLSRNFDLIDFVLRKENYSYNLTLSLKSDNSNLKVEFENIGRLSVSDFGGGLVQIKFLRIEDISDYQNDRVNYEVKTIDDDILYFVCQYFKFE